MESVFHQDYPHRQCCETLLHWHWKNENEYEQQYSTDQYHFQTTEVPHIKRFEEHYIAGQCRARYLAKTLTSRGAQFGRVCDIGAGTGAGTLAYLLAGAQVTGLEPSRPVVEWARAQCWEAYGYNGILPLIAGNWRELDFSINLVTSTDVIEHLTHPLEFLHHCRQHSNYLYLETPEWIHGRSLSWKHVRPLEHICLYTRAGLIKLAKKAGWKLVEAHSPVRDKLAVFFE